MRTTTPLAAAVLALAAVPALAACGADAADEARSALEGSLHALGAYDAEGFCSTRLTTDNSKPLKDDAAAFEKCKKDVASLKELDGQGDLAKLKDARVKDVKVDGDKATVSAGAIEGLDLQAGRAIAGGGNDASYELRKVNGAWYLANQPAPQASPTVAPSSATGAPGTTKAAATATTRAPGATTTAPAAATPAPATTATPSAS